MRNLWPCRSLWSSSGLFEEAISLISDDKWVTPPVATIDDIDIVNINNSCKKAQFDYCASGKFRWADGSIHHTPCGCRFEKRYDVKSGFIGSLGNEKRRNKARMECFSEVQEYYHLLQEAASGSQEYVRLSFNGNRDTAYLYKDGSILCKKQIYHRRNVYRRFGAMACSSIALVEGLQPGDERRIHLPRGRANDSYRVQQQH